MLTADYMNWQRQTAYYLNVCCNQYYILNAALVHEGIQRQSGSISRHHEQDVSAFSDVELLLHLFYITAWLFAYTFLHIYSGTRPVSLGLSEIPQPETHSG